MTESKEFVSFPANTILQLRVEDVEEREVQGRNGSWSKLEFTFKVVGIQELGDGSPVEACETAIGSKIWGGCSANLTDSPDNKLRQWVEAILDMEISVGFELDTDLLIGRDCRGITSTYTKKTGAAGHQVDALLPKAKAVAAAVSAPSAAAEDEVVPF